MFLELNRKQRRMPCSVGLEGFLELKTFKTKAMLD